MKKIILLFTLFCLIDHSDCFAETYTYGLGQDISVHDSSIGCGFIYVGIKDKYLILERFHLIFGDLEHSVTCYLPLRETNDSSYPYTVTANLHGKKYKLDIGTDLTIRMEKLRN